MENIEYRVLAFGEPDSVVYQLCAVYLEDGKIVSYGTDELMSSDDLVSLKWDVTRLALAFDRPILCGGSKFPEIFDVDAKYELV
jgi:hypothetical protein